MINKIEAQNLKNFPSDLTKDYQRFRPGYENFDKDDSTNKCGCENQGVVRIITLRNGNNSIAEYYNASDAPANGNFDSDVVLGPNRNRSYGLKWVWGSVKKNNLGFCTSTECTSDNFKLDLDTVKTVPIKAPKIQAINNGLGTIKIVIEKKTDIPNDLHRYKIYKDGASEDDLAYSLSMSNGMTELEFIDEVGLENCHDYYVATFTDQFGSHTSEQVSKLEVCTFDLNFRASQGESKLTLKWNPLEGSHEKNNIEDITIKRDGITVQRNIGIGEGEIIDCDAVPGIKHNYEMEITLREEDESITVLKSTRFPKLKSEGYRGPNGAVSGQILGSEGTPIASVEICATTVESIPNSPYTNVSCDTSDFDGNFRIQGILYGEESSVIVAPSKNPLQLLTPFQYELQFRFSGCSNSESAFEFVDIDFEKDESLNQEVVFTPNGDGFNDLFIVPELQQNPSKYPNNELVVFNRWGQVVYQSSPYNNNWDGQHFRTGLALPIGTYFYIIKLHLADGVVKKEKLSLIR